MGAYSHYAPLGKFFYNLMLEEITDELIKRLFKRKLTIQYKNINKIKDNTLKQSILSYLENRFSDSLSIKETIYRICYNIYNRPVCQICGNPVKFVGRQNNVFSKTCSSKCLKKFKSKQSKDYLNNIENKKKIKTATQKAIITKRNKYGKSCKNIDKSRQTIQNNKILYTVIGRDYDLEKLYKTSMTVLNRYNELHVARLNTNVFKTNNPQKNKVSKEKTKQTNNLLYGGNSPMCNKEVALKQWESVKKNKTKVSKEEQLCYNILKEIFPDVIHDYYSELYPFHCDFYIPSLELYIEYNGSQFHHFKPFDPTNPDDIKELERLNNLTNGKDQYASMINTWTVSDVNKRNIAIQNNLNYKEFYSINELNLWLKQYK